MHTTNMLYFVIMGALIGSVFTSKVAKHKYSNKRCKHINCNSRVGFRSQLWGPHLWKFMHILTLNQPRISCNEPFEEFMYSLQGVLPCKSCRDEFEAVLKQIPPKKFLKYGRIGCVGYIYLIHGIVSKRLNNSYVRPPFLQEEYNLLRDYVKLGAVNIDEFMQMLHEDAAKHKILERVDKETIKWFSKDQNV